MELRNRMRADLLAAMKRRDKPTAAALRSVITALDNAEAVQPDAVHALTRDSNGDVPRRILTEPEIQAVVRKEIDERRNAIDVYVRHGELDAADRLRAEVCVIETYSTPQAPEYPDAVSRSPRSR